MIKEIILVFILFSTMVTAATIQGKIYDMGLELRPNTKISVDTTPKQIFISKDGSYSFNVEEGNYTIIAKYYSDGEVISSFDDNIRIEKEGTYNLDIVLFDVIDDSDLSTDKSFDATISIEDNISGWWFTLILPFLIIVILILWWIKRKKKFKDQDLILEGEDEYLQEITKVIKAEGGRITQKELRKKFPISEAKVSLLITELVSQGKLKKIKKGRGNVIILTK